MVVQCDAYYDTVDEADGVVMDIPLCARGDGYGDGSLCQCGCGRFAGGGGDGGGEALW